MTTNFEIEWHDTSRTRQVEHVPKWQPAQLRVDAAGNTKPGFKCVHELEDGNGRCGGNVFDTADAIGTHSCFVTDDVWRHFWSIFHEVPKFDTAGDAWAYIDSLQTRPRTIISLLEYRVVKVTVSRTVESRPPQLITRALDQW